MKLLISTILCACLLACEFQANAVEGPAKERQVGQNAVVLGLFVLCCVACGGYIIWKVRQANPPVGAKATLALDKTYDWSTWTPVCTNTFVLTNACWLELFREQMTEECAFYRVRKVN